MNASLFEHVPEGHTDADLVRRKREIRKLRRDSDVSFWTLSQLFDMTIEDVQRICRGVGHGEHAQRRRAGRI